MTKPINTASIEAATGQTWQQWIEELNSMGARELSHTEIATDVNRRLEGKVDSPGWWAQGITVAYEQHIGRRVPGQRANGLFDVAVSKTIAVPRPALFAQVVSWLEQQESFDGNIPLKPRSSETPNRSTWRCDFADGSKLSATVEGTFEKSKLVLTHTGLSHAEQAAEWKEYWRGVAVQLADNIVHG